MSIFVPHQPLKLMFLFPHLSASSLSAQHSATGAEDLQQAARHTDPVCPVVTVTESVLFLRFR